MSRPDNGSNMDWPSHPSASARQPRAGIQPGLPRDHRPPVYQPQVTQDTGLGYSAPFQPLVPPQATASPRSMRPKSPAAQAGKITKVISRPVPVPQWPFPAPSTPSSQETDSYRPPPGRPLVAPQRPPRPSRIPSLVEQSRLQEPTPLFRAPLSVPESTQEYDQSRNPSSSPPYSSSGAAPTSEESIPESPLPAATPSTGTSRKSANLGPPPSSRRGQSSLYSTASFVSPIPEEGLGSRPHASYASSTAMPNAWRTGRMGGSPGYAETFDEESLTDKSGHSDEYGDECRLVRGTNDEKGPTSTVVAHPMPDMAQGERQLSSPTISSDGRADFNDLSSDSSNTFFMNKQTPATTPGTASNTAPTPVAMANSEDPAELRKATGSPQPVRRLSAMRRPPRLDMDAVRAAEARGSLTSLPDLIRRATRLAAMIDKGRRPSSRLDDLEFFKEKSSSIEAGRRSYLDERYLSGLSDMLAAFPPPVHTPQNGQAGSWPLVSRNGVDDVSEGSDPKRSAKKKGRRCCGLPVWGFVMVVMLILCIIAAAVVLPLEFFVFKNLGNQGSSDMTLQDCQRSLKCLNGGTNVISQNMCSCICTNGFTGVNCDTAGSAGCTTTNLVATDGSSRIDNVTLGNAIPRIIADSSANYSITLSGTNILAKINAANLSCIAQNSLVTFNGQSTRVSESSVQVGDSSGNVVKARVDVNDNIPLVTPSTTSLLRRDGGSSTPSSNTPAQTAAFNVTQEVLDFARTAVLYVLQQNSVDAASTAQSQLQQFFSKASIGLTETGTAVTEQEASSINIGGDSTIDLVGSTVNLGQVNVGGTTTSKRNIPLDSLGEEDSAIRTANPSQPLCPRRMAVCR